MMFLVSTDNHTVKNVPYKIDDTKSTIICLIQLISYRLLCVDKFSLSAAIPSFLALIKQ